ncbi:DUF1800 domain-containing protein [Maricaulis sp.]|uniref:DUF1800 domain-containing protein n=1 Tax=Maricaulis sp. TaxID=1486257 RepID=UPI00261A444F|nr:DUF1800 domain-containing protein [Maricaulis sp.]
MPQSRLGPILKTAVLALTLSLAACGGGGGGTSDGGTNAPPAPPQPPTPTPQPVTRQAILEASKFLNQATFGPTYTEAEDLAYSSQSLWLRDQFAAAPTLHVDALLADGVANDFESFRAASDSYWGAIISGEDQLRQRMVFALSQILVISEGQTSVLSGLPLTSAHYMDILSRNAFGNYRDLLEDVTYSPAMAAYLTYLYNAKGDMETGRVPDENYAREIMQLFTIGLVELRMDGSVVMDGNGRPIETYDNTDVTGLARVFTGLGLNGENFWPDDSVADATYTPLEVFEFFHSDLEKSFLGTTIPAGTRARTSIDTALDTLFNHPNLPPFISRQLIQRFTTSHPSPAYIQRVATVFANGSYTLPDGTVIGEGQRGDLAATLAAILMDSEARQAPDTAPNDWGKVREPVLRFTHWARAFGIDGTQAWREDYLWDTSSSGSLGQHPFRAPSVFNFYRPGYVAPGTETGAAGLTAPELQIVNEASVIGFANFMSAFITDNTWGDNRTETLGFHPDYTAEMAIADDPDALLDRLDAVFTYGTLSTATRDRMREIIAGVPIDDQAPDEGRLGRVQIGVLMILTAPEYTVLR